MLLSTILMALIAIILLAIGIVNGQGQHITGLKLGSKLLLQVIPILVFAFIVAGMMQALIPKEQISKWIGSESGMKGIFLGTVAGAFMPGGPYVSLPVAATLVHSGAGIGTMVAFLTGWSLWAFARLPIEIGVLGWKLTLIRFLSTFLLAPLAGIIANSISILIKK